MRMILIGVIMLGGLYLGIGGWLKTEHEYLLESIYDNADENQPVVYRGMTFKTRRLLEAALQDEKYSKFWPWIFALPSFSGLLVTACAFGMLGGLTRVLKQIVVDNQTMSTVSIFVGSMFGFLMGLMVLGASLFVPTALTLDTSINLNPTSLLFLTLFAGAFSKRAYLWIEDKVDIIFSITT